jgi:hypothetical protein
MRVVEQHRGDFIMTHSNSHRLRYRRIAIGTSVVILLGAAMILAQSPRQTNYPPFDLMGRLGLEARSFEGDHGTELAALVEKARRDFDVEETRAAVASYLYWGVGGKSDSPLITPDGSTILFRSDALGQGAVGDGRGDGLWLWTASDASCVLVSELPAEAGYRPLLREFAVNDQGDAVAFLTRRFEYLPDEKYDESVDAWLWRAGSEGPVELGELLHVESDRTAPRWKNSTQVAIAFGKDGEGIVAYGRRGEGLLNESLLREQHAFAFDRERDAFLRLPEGDGALAAASERFDADRRLGGLWLDRGAVGLSLAANPAGWPPSAENVVKMADEAEPDRPLAEGLAANLDPERLVETTLRVAKEHVATPDGRYVAFSSIYRFDGEARPYENEEIWLLDTTTKTFTQVSDGRFRVAPGEPPPIVQGYKSDSLDLLRLAWAGDRDAIPLLKAIIASEKFRETHSERWNAHARMAMALLGEPLPPLQDRLDFVALSDEAKTSIDADANLADVERALAALVADEAFASDADWTKLKMLVTKVETKDGVVELAGHYPIDPPRPSRSGGPDRTSNGNWTMRMSSNEGGWTALYFTNIFGPLNGYGYIGMMRKTGDRWALVHWDNVWVS